MPETVLSSWEGLSHFTFKTVVSLCIPQSRPWDQTWAQLFHLEVVPGRVKRRQRSRAGQEGRAKALVTLQVLGLHLHGDAPLGNYGTTSESSHRRKWRLLHSSPDPHPHWQRVSPRVRTPLQFWVAGASWGQPSRWSGARKGPQAEQQSDCTSWEGEPSSGRTRSSTAQVNLEMGREDPGLSIKGSVTAFLGEEFY